MTNPNIYIYSTMVLLRGESLAFEGPLVYLTYIGVILFVGILCTAIANKLKIPNILFLILVGLFLGSVPYRGRQLIFFPEVFVASISILALAIIVFDSASRFKLREIKAYSFPALNLSIVFLVINLVVLSSFSYLIFREINSFWYALLFAAIMSGTDPSAVMLMFGKAKHKVLEVLEIESIINTPLIVLIPFIILDIQQSIGEEFIVSQIISQIGPFLQQIVTGIGTGILIGIVVFNFMRKVYSQTLSPLALVTAALLTYIIAENLGGNGVLAVTVMGLFFGNLYVKEKEHLTEYSSMFANSLEILVFVLVGLIIKGPFTFSFITRSLLLFAVYILLRFLSVSFAFRNQNYSIKQKIFMSLNVQKGIAVAVVVLTLSTLGISAMKPVLDLALIFMLYSIILATIAGKFVNLFLEFPPEEKVGKAVGKAKTEVTKAATKLEKALGKLEKTKVKAQEEIKEQEINKIIKKIKKGQKCSKISNILDFSHNHFLKFWFKGNQLKFGFIVRSTISGNNDSFSNIINFRHINSNTHILVYIAFILLSNPLSDCILKRKIKQSRRYSNMVLDINRIEHCTQKRS